MDHLGLVCRNLEDIISQMEQKYYSFNMIFICIYIFSNNVLYQSIGLRKCKIFGCRVVEHVSQFDMIHTRIHTHASVQWSVQWLSTVFIQMYYHQILHSTTQKDGQILPFIHSD